MFVDKLSNVASGSQLEAKRVYAGMDFLKPKAPENLRVFFRCLHISASLVSASPQGRG